MTLQVLRLPPESAEHLGLDMLDFLDRIVNETQGEFSRSDLLEWLAKDSAQIFAVFLDDKLSGIIVTEIVVFPNMDVCHIIGLAGDEFLRWPHAINEIEDYARVEGCKRVTWAGRRGFVKVMKDFGYSVDYTVMGRNLEA